MDEMMASWLGDLPGPDTRWLPWSVSAPSGCFARLGLFRGSTMWRSGSPDGSERLGPRWSRHMWCCSRGPRHRFCRCQRLSHGDNPDHGGSLPPWVATANVMAADVGASVSVVDVGVGRPTGDISSMPAMSPGRFIECWDAGRRAVSEASGADLLVLGEMGIGNTTAASAVCASVVRGPGGPVDRSRHRDRRGNPRAEDGSRGCCAETCRRAGPFEALRQVGGSELTAVAAAALEARVRSIPVILDGFVVTAACAALEVARPGALDHTVAGHCSAESGHRLLLEKLSKPPLIDLGLRLGEGTGAGALPLVRLAAKCVIDVATFDEWVT